MQAGIKGSGPRSGEKKTKKGPKMGPRVKLGLGESYRSGPNLWRVT